MKVKRKAVQCLVDSGSITSVISQSLASKLGLPIQATSFNTPLLAATGKPLKAVGSVDITFQLQGLLIPHTFLVIEDLYPTLILGADFLRKNNASISYTDNTVRFYDNLICAQLQSFNSARNCAAVAQTVCMPKCSEAIIPVKLPRAYTGKQVILEPLSVNNTMVATAGCISSVTKNSAFVRVLNYNLHPVVLRRGMKIASVLYPHSVLSITPFKTIDEQPVNNNKHSPEILEQFLKDYHIDVNPELSTADRTAFTSLLYDYKDLFARSLQDIKVYPDFELELPLKNPNATSYTRQYPLSRDDTLEADRQINELRRKGLISENDNSSFNSPIFIARKRDGSGRMLVDLRHVNRLLNPYIIQLPKIDTLLQEITALKPKILSSIDIFKGFYNVRLSPKTNFVTAFTNPKTGMSQVWNVLPMGLSVSPAAFIYVMSRVFKDKTKFNFLFMYVDDLLAVSSSVPEHLQHLTTVFETLRRNNIVINPTKTTIGYTKMNFLGYTVSEQGISISPSKIQAIERIQAPKTRKSLQRLLGLLNFFRKQIPNFSQRTVNMRRLLKQDVKFDWSSACDDELTSLKQTLISNPVFRPLQPTKPVYVYIDAALSGYGSAVIQYDDDGLPHVCAYLSHATTDSQKKWPIYMLELSALALTLRAYESFLLHLDINVFSDNAVVVQLAKYKPINNREKRLIAYLSQFRLNIRYISGSDNKIADCLSRIAEDLNAEQIAILRPPTVDLRNEFLLAMTAPPVDSQSGELAADSGANAPADLTDNLSTGQTEISPDGVWRAYTFQCTSLSQPTAAISTAEDSLNVNALTSDIDKRDSMQPTRRSKRLIERAERINQQISPTADKPTMLTQLQPATSTAQIDAQGNAPTDIINNDRSVAAAPHPDASLSTSELLSAWHADTEQTGQTDQQDTMYSAELIDQSISKPTITSQDYIDDSEFSALYSYLRDGRLTGDNNTDRKLLLISENYYIENDLLYKCSLPRGRKEKRLRSTYYQLCVPQQYRESLIKQYHLLLGHFSIQRLHPTLVVHYYWQNLILDIKNFVRCCPVCQTSKVSTRPPVSPLNPLPTPVRPFQFWSFDHRKLARTTNDGNNYVLAFICHFSNYVIFAPVPDECAYTTARIFVKEVLARHGQPELVLSDKAPGYMSLFFATVAKILGVRHRTSAAQCSRTNGLAEQAIKRLNEGLKRSASSDVDD